MKYLLAFGCLLLLLIVIQSDGKRVSLRLPKRHHPSTTGRRLVKHLIRYTHEIHRGNHRREKRQFSPQCLDDLTELSSQKFLRCKDILDEFDANDTISTSNIHTFCYFGCGQYIKTLYGKITKDCPGSTDGNLDPQTVAFLDGSCYHDPKNRYCLDDWENADTSDIDEEYEDCLDSTRDQENCASDCSKATRYVVDNFGCCYSYLQDFSDDLDFIIPSDAFSECKVKVPVHCLS